MERATINVPVHIELDSDAAATGYASMTDILFDDRRTEQQKAQDLTECIVTTMLNDPLSDATAQIYGMACWMSEWVTNKHVRTGER